MISGDMMIGLIGMALILVAFILNEVSGHIDRESKEYNILNILGSTFLIFYAYALSSWPFLILNIVWAIVAVWKLSTLLMRKSRKKK